MPKRRVAYPPELPAADQVELVRSGSNLRRVPVARGISSHGAVSLSTQCGWRRRDARSKAGVPMCQ